MLCRNCKHFVPNKNYTAVENRLKKGCCNHPVLRIVDNVSGIVYLQEARVIRDNEELCGPDAKLYVEEHNKVALFLRGINGISPELIIDMTLHFFALCLCIFILCLLRFGIVSI